MITRIFLLSPAFCGGRRAKALLRSDSTMPLAARLRAGDLSLGEAFSFVSGLYFRGKLTYARHFSGGETTASGATLVITPTRGLLRPEAIVTADDLREFAAVDIADDEERYRRPLVRDLDALAASQPPDTTVVLLGSIATGKYVDLLTATFGPRLLFPPSFIGRGDMSRGGLLLRSARESVELEYAVLDPATRRTGPRPPKLPPLRGTVTA